VAFSVRIFLVVSLSPRPSIVVYTCSTVSRQQQMSILPSYLRTKTSHCGRKGVPLPQQGREHRSRQQLTRSPLG
jgi:hypothetical protein